MTGKNNYGNKLKYSKNKNHSCYIRIYFDWELFFSELSVQRQNSAMKKKIGLLLTLTLFYFLVHAQSSFRVRPGVTITTGNNAVITLNDLHLINEGTILQEAGDGKFVFTGSANTEIFGGGDIQFDVMEIAKTGSARVTLNQEVLINSEVNFTSGVIDLFNNFLVLATDALLIGESETSYITGQNGYIEIRANLNSPSSVNLGNLGAQISSTANLGPTIIRRGHASQTNGFGTGSSIHRYYDILPSNNGGLNATLRFHYLDTELNGLNENDLVTWRSQDNTTWINQGADARNTTLDYVEKNGIDAFSRWTLSSALNVLPLVWGSINTHCMGGSVKINWQTRQEANTMRFIVQRSNNGTDWNDIAELPAMGNTSTTTDYSYTDMQAPARLNYYRILQEDIDGRRTFSPIMRSSCENTDALLVYPNPASNTVWISFSSQSTEKIRLMLYDNKGALVKQQLETMQVGANLVELPLNNLASGIYHLVVTDSEGNTRSRKIEKL